MRAFFGLKRTVIRSKLSFKALTTLFDSLIKPIILYGAPIWTPTSAINKSIIKFCSTKSFNTQNFVSKINRTPSEKVHLAFLKWALGVHCKASNIGVWGETGRYPLIYQSIRLTLNYYKRLIQMPNNTFVHAALKEQKKLNLPWYNNIEPLLKIDDVYLMDHVPAYRPITKSSLINLQNEIPKTSIKTPCINDLSKLTKAKPLPSEKFRVQSIIRSLTDHFVQCWEYEKGKSSKLSFYHLHKTKFAREAYIDAIKGFSRRYNTTKLRISSHDLEIERGRYTNTPRELRICNWCNISMGKKTIENEYHFLFECDLYATLRAKLITSLNSLPSNCVNNLNNSQFHLKVDNDALKANFMNMLSPNCVSNISDVPIDSYNSHHKLLQNHKEKSINPEIETLINRRSFILNCLTTLITHSQEKRKKFNDQLREHQNDKNTITIHFKHR